MQYVNIFRLGDSYFGKESYSQALDSYKQALSLSHSDPPTIERLKVCMDIDINIYMSPSSNSPLLSKNQYYPNG